MFISAAGIPSVPERIKKLNHVLQMLPPVNAATVHYIVRVPVLYFIFESNPETANRCRS